MNIVKRTLNCCHDDKQSQGNIVAICRSSITLVLIAIALSACDSSSGDNAQAVLLDCASELVDGACVGEIDLDTTHDSSSGDDNGGGLTLNAIPPDSPNGRYLLNSNNSAILTGPIFGAGEVDNQNIAKSLKFEVAESASGLKLIELRVIDDEYGPRLLGIVENTGTEFDCYSAIEGLGTYSSTGQLLNSGSQTDPISVVGVVGTSVTVGRFAAETNTCVSPGSLAYIQKGAGRNATFTEVVEARAEAFTQFQRQEHFVTDASVLPVSYVPVEYGVRITIVNNHNLAVNVYNVDAFALDANAQAIGSDVILVAEVLEPGQEMILNPILTRFQGRTSQMRVVIDYRLIDGI